MPTSQIVYRCLIISPGDVWEARDGIEAAIRDWNAHTGPMLSARVEAVRWESHAIPEMGGHPQEIINHQLVDECDFGVALFWSRIGSPTEKHESGSAEEIARLLDRNARVMVYFCDAPIPQNALADDQFHRLQTLRRRYQATGLLGTYTTTDDLREQFKLHLNQAITEMLIQERQGDNPSPVFGAATATPPDVKVTATAGFAAGEDGTVGILIVKVENHSPVNVFVNQVTLELEGGDQALLKNDYLTGEYNSPRKLEAGDSFNFTISPAVLASLLDGKKPVCAIMVDKIGRVYRSDPTTFGAAFANAEAASRAALQSRAD